MATRLQRWLNAGLAACLVLAGCVGSSPLLHLWFEHSGGPAHTHRPGAETLRRTPLRAVSINGELGGVGNLVLERLDSSADSANERQEDHSSTPHDHHSLPQLLASGLIEDDTPASISVSRPSGIAYRIPTFAWIFPVPAWEAQAPARGPPLLRS